MTQAIPFLLYKLKTEELAVQEIKRKNKAGLKRFLGEIKMPQFKSFGSKSNKVSNQVADKNRSTQLDSKPNFATQDPLTSDHFDFSS